MTERDTSLKGDEVPREQQLGELYRELPFSEPPMHLDANILKAAREDTVSQPSRGPIQPFSRHWAWPVSLVALMVLSVSVVVLVQPQVGLDDAVLLPPLTEDLQRQSTQSAKPAATATSRSQALEPQDERVLNMLEKEIPAPAVVPAPPPSEPRPSATMVPMQTRSLSPSPSQLSPTSIPQAPIPEPQVETTPAQTPSATLQAAPQSLRSGTANDASKRLQEAPEQRSAAPTQALKEEQLRRARQSAERDAARARQRAAAQESRKRETASARRDELKRLLDAAEQPKPAQPAARSAPAQLKAPATSAAPADDAPAHSGNKAASTRPAPVAVPQKATRTPSSPPRGSAASPTVRSLGSGLRSKDVGGDEQADGPAAPAAQNSTVDPITREFARIRALLEKGDKSLAREVLTLLLKRYPGIPVPQDIRSQLE